MDGLSHGAIRWYFFGSLFKKQRWQHAFIQVLRDAGSIYSRNAGNVVPVYSSSAGRRQMAGIRQPHVFTGQVDSGSI